MIPSPCVGTCRIDQASGLCLGCARTGAEIATWSKAPPEALERIWAELPGRRSELGIDLHRLGWDPGQIRSFIAGTLRAGAGTWVFGVSGAVAEFCIGPDESPAIQFDETCLIAATPRAAIRIEITDHIRALSFAEPGQSATDGFIVLAISRTRAKGEAPSRLSALGADRGAIHPADRDDRLYDFGLGMRAASFCFRTADADLIRDLDARVGRGWPDFLAELGGEIIRASPTRVVRTPIGRIEVNVPIPPPGGQSPEGPHTHFLPALIAGGRETPVGLEIPEAFIPCALFYPAPAVDAASGEET